MKTSLGFFLPAWFALVGCSVDVGKLQAPAVKGPDAAADTARDLRPDLGTSGTSDADGPRLQPDGPAAAIDAQAPADDAPLGDTQALGDAPDDAQVAGADATPVDDAPVAPDLPPESPDLPEASPDLSLGTPDLPPEAPDLALSDVEDSATPDLAPEDSGEDAPSDLASPADTRDAGGRSNGSSCTSADQCQSGFCVGLPGRCCAQGCSSVCYRANQCATTGSCVAAPGALTCGDLDAVCGLTVSDFANAYEWSLQPNLQVGNLATGSDEHTLSAVPTELRGSPWIRPARGSKSTMANPLVTFTLSAPADVYVGIDTRVSVPSWLSSWTNSGMTISYVVYSPYEPTTTVTQRLFQARFPAGSVSLGPLGCIYTSSCSMYLTIIRFADQPSGTTPSCQ